MDYHKIAEEIYDMSYVGDDKKFRISKVQEIEDWLSDGYVEEGATIEQLYLAWEEYSNCEYEDEDYYRNNDEYEDY